MNDLSNLKGLIPIIGGIYALLLAQGVLPRKTNKPEEWALWRRKFGGFIMVAGPLLILFGIAQLFGMFKT